MYSEGTAVACGDEKCPWIGWAEDARVLSLNGENVQVCPVCEETIHPLDWDETYCHACSEASGADRAVHHLPPACKG